ncbi:MAG: M14-type cytosolic carboxypeptidase [Anaerolineae bacterium]
MTVQAAFECGNIVLESETASDVALLIRPDTNAEYFQWFYFGDVNPPSGIARTYRIYNAGGASYPRAWVRYNVLASYDGTSWFRIPTHFDGSHLAWTHKADGRDVLFAFFVPYGEQRREALMEEAGKTSIVKRKLLGSTTQGRKLDLLVFGDETRPNAKTIWVVSRQHAGEPMAEYATEGFIRHLLDSTDAIARQLLSKATVYVVPNMNPDGSAAGNLRANAQGVDLNRVWHEPGDNAPEVQAVVSAIAKTGCDYFIDMHGDETRPFIWLINPAAEMNPEQKKIHEAFESFLSSKHPELAPPPEEILKGTAPAVGMSINYMFRTYQSYGWIVELPFCEPSQGDTLLEEGCMAFGHNCVDALAHVIE